MLTLNDFFWPGMFDWICTLTADCPACQNNEPKPKYLKEVPPEEWQGDTTPFPSIHFDHKGPLHPLNNRNTHCLLIVGSILGFLMVYTVSNTGAKATIAAVENWILRLGTPQSIMHNRGTAFLKTDFVNWTTELGITLRPRTAQSVWTNGKVETQSQHFARYWRSLLNDAGTNWASLAPKFAFAQNTSVNYTTGKMPYEIVFGAKPQIRMSVNLGVCRNKHRICCSEFCTDFTPHTQDVNSRRRSSSGNYFDHNFFRLC